MCVIFSSAWIILVPFVLVAAFVVALVKFGKPRWLGNGDAAAMLIFLGSAVGLSG